MDASIEDQPDSGSVDNTMPKSAEVLESESDSVSHGLLAIKEMSGGQPKNGTDSVVKDEAESSEGGDCVSINDQVFKKPMLLIGPRKGKIVGKIKPLEIFTKSQPPDQSKSETSDPSLEKDTDTDTVCKDLSEENNLTSTPLEEVESETTCEQKISSKISPAQKLKDISTPLPYKEPKWGGIPMERYSFEILKSGSILDTIDLCSKPFYVFGRLSTCDIHMAHPMVSRFHAVLQYRSEETEEKPVGFYIYDLGSTHGTFLNKFRIKPYMYVRMHVGHMLKLGGSTRMFILQGPNEDMEQESDLTVTQLKEKRKQEQLAKAQDLAQEMKEERVSEEKADNNGIDWGLGEDADEETDLSENPFAATQNEELYIADPKKTLRGWFEREGYELEYDVEEKGFGQFLCRVELPMETTRSGTMVAEALVKGKKKEAVVQCALEACRILDRYGLLRQANHESRKRKAKNWEEEDFYDSDEDTFLDRTGAVEKKRQQRMQAAGKIETQTDTYESLMEKHSKIVSEMQEVEAQLGKASAKRESPSVDNENEEVDALDAFMTNLSSGTPDKKLLRKLKSQLATLKEEESRLRKLVNIARPASLPVLVHHKEATVPCSRQITGSKALPLIGVRRKANTIKTQVHSVEQEKSDTSATKEEEEEEEEEEEVEEEDAGGEEVVCKDTGNSNSEREHREVENIVEESSVITIHETVEVGSVCHSPEKPSKVIGPSLPPSGIVLNDEGAEKRRRRNKRKLEHKNEKAKSMKSSSDDYNSSDPDYSTWVPPSDQSGDGRTKLNDKYGY